MAAAARHLEALRKEMDHCSIAGALVASTLSITYDPMHANLALSRDLAPFDHLFPIWNVMPQHSGEVPPPEALGALLREHDVRAVTLSPAANAWDWEAESSRELLAWLAGRRILTILARGEVGSYRDLDRFLAQNSELPVLLIGAGSGEQRYVIPLLRAHRNLHLSFERFQIHYGLEDLVAMGCEDQLLFASNAPAMSIGAHRCYVDYAALTSEVRTKIAGGNLTRLLGGQAPPRARTNADEDAIMAAARQGQPLPVDFLDLHMHILPEGSHGGGGAHRMSRGGPEGVFKLLARLGCTGGGFMSWNGTVSCDSAAGNECVREALDVAPPGYWGLASFDPVHYTQAELAERIPAAYADGRFIGMKPYVRYGVEYHDPSYDLWWRFGEENGLYALLHRTRGDFKEVDTLAEKYPNVRWLVAHCGSDYKAADGVIESIRRNPNVYAEITYTSVTLGIIEYLAEHAGADRVVYGSDLPMRDPRQQLGWVVYSRLPVEDKRKVLRENALRIIAPCLSRLPEHNRPAGSAPKP